MQTQTPAPPRTFSARMARTRCRRTWNFFAKASTDHLHVTCGNVFMMRAWTAYRYSIGTS